jgi:hypothetical protein
VASGQIGGSENLFVVVDGTEGKPYLWSTNQLVLESSLAFDSADKLHYFAFKNDGIYLVEERLR